MDAIVSISDHVESLQRRGRYAFTRAESAAVLSLSEAALTKGLQRLTRKGGCGWLRRGFYVIIPVEYSATGMIPTDWFIAELMQFLDLHYYIGVLTAQRLCMARRISRRRNFTSWCRSRNGLCARLQ